MSAPRSTILLAAAAHPLAVAVVAAAGAGLLTATRTPFDSNHATTAAVLVAAAAELATVPLAVAVLKRLSPANASPAALLATVVHLLVTAGGLVALSPAKGPGAAGFAYWTFSFYLATLATVAAAAVAVVRGASAAGPDLLTRVPL